MRFKQLFLGTIKFPFMRFWRLFYVLWLAVPVIGLLAFWGYLVKLGHALATKEEKEALPFSPFWNNVKLGLKYFIFSMIYSIPAMILAFFTPMLGIIFSVAVSFMMPVLFYQFADALRLKDGLRIAEACRRIVENLSSYLKCLLVYIIISATYVAASMPFITLIITLPAMSYATLYIWGCFYRETKGEER